MELLFPESGRWWFSYSVLLMLTEVYSQRTETLRLERFLNIWMRKSLWFHHCYLVRHDCSSPSWMTFMKRKQVGVSRWIIQMIIAAVWDAVCVCCKLEMYYTLWQWVPPPPYMSHSFLSFDRCNCRGGTPNTEEPRLSSDGSIKLEQCTSSIALSNVSSSVWMLNVVFVLFLNHCI